MIVVDFLVMILSKYL